MANQKCKDTETILQETGRMCTGLFRAYICLYPGKADVIQDAIQAAIRSGGDPEAEVLAVL